MWLEDLFDRKYVISFEQCICKYDIPWKDFWKFLQSRSCITIADWKVKFFYLSLVFKSYGDQTGGLEDGHPDFMTCLENINPQTMKVLS